MYSLQINSFFSRLLKNNPVYSLWVWGKRLRVSCRLFVSGVSNGLGKSRVSFM
ncbi:hypothetical protein MNBD_GAMMA08-2450 [hydrothermal vent metagenome]|uniref:Uncharacterized protein n=1 Tax=hydrothermal vent metagenome TaxID=652676 RepID=A0A3B0X7X3_9ZZZZ